MYHKNYGKIKSSISIHLQSKGVLRFVAFPATEYDEILSGYQPGQMVER
jgi:hypothetical protein